MKNSKQYAREASLCVDAHETLDATLKTIPVTRAVGTIFTHDINEIGPSEFTGRASKKAMWFAKRAFAIFSVSARIL